MLQETELKQLRQIPQGKDYWLVARESREEFRNNLNTISFNIRGVEISKDRTMIIAGPCAVHSRKQTLEIAKKVKEAGADMLRGGAYKPRTSPYAFQGLEEEGLKILAEARELTGLPVVTEVMDPRLVELVGQYADVLQIGARNMQNFPLLVEVGRYAARHDKGVLLKTSLMPKLNEVLCAAEYLANEGAEKIIICERGISVTTGSTRNTPHPSFVRELRQATFLPVIGDPSHSTGDRELVEHTSDMYLAAKANGLLIDVVRDDEPEVINGQKVCDYKQGLPASRFRSYMEMLRKNNGI